MHLYIALSTFAFGLLDFKQNVLSCLLSIFEMSRTSALYHKADLYREAILISRQIEIL